MVGRGQAILRAAATDEHETHELVGALLEKRRPLLEPYADKDDDEIIIMTLGSSMV